MKSNEIQQTKSNQLKSIKIESNRIESNRIKSNRRFDQQLLGRSAIPIKPGAENFRIVDIVINALSPFFLNLQIK